MKIKSLLLAGLMALLCMTVMTACSNSVDDSEGAVLEIDLSKFENLDQIKDKNIVYEIDIIDNGGTTVESLKPKKGDKIKVKLSIGVYTISVTAFLDGEEFAKGEEKNKTVTQGSNSVTVYLNLSKSVPLEVSPLGGTSTVTADPFKITLTSNTGVSIEYSLTGAQSGSGTFPGTGEISISNVGTTTLNAIARGNGLLEDSLPLKEDYTLNTAWTATPVNSGNYTTAINFNFILPVSGLTANDITITGGSGFEKGALTGSGKAWTLAVTPTMASVSNVQVNINKAGVASGNKPLTITLNTAWTAAGNGNSTTTTTAIIFNFDLPVSGLTANDIIITGGTGAFTKGSLSSSNGDRTWTLAGTPVKDGSIQVNINKTGIVSGNQTITRVYRLFPLWTAIPLGTINSTTTTFGTSTINAIAYGNGKFVAVGEGGKMAYSSDGINWTAIPAGAINSTTTTFSTSTIKAIAYGNGMFVAVGEDGKMAYSTNGINWYGISSVFGTPYDIQIVAWGVGAGKFVAGNKDGKIAYSTDGINWTYGGILFVRNVSGIAWGNNKFVAIGNSVEIGYSTDGITWTGNSYIIRDKNYIVWGDNKFVAIGDYGGIAYSFDGISWYNITAGTGGGTTTFGTSSSINGIYWSGSRFVAVGDSGKMAWSSDGITWTAIGDSTFGTSVIRGIVYANNMFISVGDNGKIAYSLTE